MSQHDFNITNSDANTGASFRSEVNTALQALASNSKGTTEPAIKYPYQKWADDTTGYMKLRNGANTAWINLYKLEGSAGGLFSPIAGPGSSQAFAVGAFTQTGNALLAQTTGSLLIGTTTDDGVNKLQVNGGGYFAGGITSSGATAPLVSALTSVDEWTSGLLTPGLSIWSLKSGTVNGVGGVDRLTINNIGDSTLNGRLAVTGGISASALPVYADNTAAAALATGTMYRTSTGVVMIKY